MLQLHNPRQIWAPKRLLISNDPVALDSVGTRIIEGRRAAQGLPPLARMGWPWKHIATAASRKLGTDDPDNIDIVRLEV